MLEPAPLGPATHARVRRAARRRRHRTFLAVLAALAFVAAAFGLRSATAHDPAPSADTLVLFDGRGSWTLLSTAGPDAQIVRFEFGDPGDLALVGDWDCDGIDGPGVFRPTTGEFFLRNDFRSGPGERRLVFGDPGDVPLVGDFDADGCDSVAVFRPREAKLYVRNTLTSGVAEYAFYFGDVGDDVFTGDFDGDGVDSFAIRRPDGSIIVGRTPETPTPATSFLFGNPGDAIFAGDWDGDGRDTVGVHRPSEGRVYLRNVNRSGFADLELYVGPAAQVMAVSGVDPEAIRGEPLPDPPPPPTRASTTQEETAAPDIPEGPPTDPEPPTPSPGDDPPAAEPPLETPAELVPSGPIVISGEDGVVVEGLEIANPDGRCVEITASTNVVIRDSKIGPCGTEAIYLSDVEGARIVDNTITDTGNGVLVHRSRSVVVDGNRFEHAGRNFVQFDKVNGPGSSISWNVGENALGASGAEDLISLFSSNGTPESPILVEGNRLRNGGPSNSGSGIMLGDGGGSHQVARGNRLVDPGQVGIGVAGGSSIRVLDNLVYSASHPWSNVGIYAMNFYDGCSDVEIAGNRVNWTSGSGYANGFWTDGSCSGLSEHDNDWNAGIGPEIY